MNIKKLKNYCNQIGITNVKIAGIGPYYELEKIILERNSKQYITGMEEESIEKRINPRCTMKNANSIIVCAFPYYMGDYKNSNISKYCYGKDYHLVIKEKLEEISKYIKNEVENFEYMVFTDNGPLVDRYLAKISGLGFYGINNNIITDEFGSYIFIGYIINNLKFDIDEEKNKTCKKCGLCQKACPGGAILGNFAFDPKKCLSYLTQKKEELTTEEIESLRKGSKVFGCDICQEVCPHNKHIERSNIEEFYKDIKINLDKDEIMNISNKEFKRRYKDKAFSWRGKKVIQRNIEILDKQNF